ncbi:transposase [Pararhodonellum marinum]|uniref:transposase n=1 Tax=Pararhodonellum marinum TaxID=2755358 RepID=UPI00188F90B0|nr:transposase [Pararhodonellum marinum]
MRHSHSEIWTHLVLGTKNHQPLLKDSWVPVIRVALEDFISQIPDNQGTFCILPDHIHFLVKLPEELSIKGLTYQIQKLIEDRIKNYFDEAKDFQWEDQYHAHSVSLNRLSLEKNIIERQKIKHLEMSLEEELKFLGL